MSKPLIKEESQALHIENIARSDGGLNSRITYENVMQFNYI
jgi:hypothetical protein